MRISAIFVLFLLTSSPALAQEYAQQAYQPQPQLVAPQPQQVQVTGNYYREPTYAPQPAYTPAPQPVQPAPAQHTAQPEQNVITDIRQMNF